MAKTYFITPDDKTELMLTGGNAKTLARLLPRISSRFEEDKGQWVAFDWQEFKQAASTFLNQSIEKLMDRWQFQRPQAEVFKTALEVFQMTGRIFQSNKVIIPFIGLKEALLLEMVANDFSLQQPTNSISLVLPSTENPIEVPVS